MMKAMDRRSGENSKDYAYRTIRENIMSLALEPGQTISEIDLAEALRVSRTPVREVMAKLKEEHLVEVIPQVGTYISKIDGQLIKEAAFMRFTLEREVLLLACRTFGEEEIAELRRNLRMQQELLNRPERAADFHELDNEFHALLFTRSGKAHIWRSVSRLSTHYNRLRLLFEMEHHFAQAAAQHEEIVQLIEQRRTDRVEQTVRQHIIDPMSQWEALMSEQSRYESYFKGGQAFNFSAAIPAF